MNPFQHINWRDSEWSFRLREVQWYASDFCQQHALLLLLMALAIAGYVVYRVAQRWLDPESPHNVAQRRRMRHLRGE